MTDEQWQARSTSDGAWRSAQTVGPLSLHYGVGTDRQRAIPGPDRIVTDASLLRKDFSVDSSIHTARLTITALGAYQQFFINGKSVAPDTLLAPGWTDFHKRVLYQTYDVTLLLTQGANTLGVLLGGGWYSSPMTWSGFRETPGPNLLRAQLDLTLPNGTHQTIVTDPSWTFTDHIEPWLAKAVAEGRKAEFAEHGWDEPDVPDPQDEATFLRSKLDWEQRHHEPYLGLHAWYRELIALRRARTELTDPRLDRVHADFDDDARWLLVRRGRLRIAANLGTSAVRLPLGQPGTGVLAASSPDVAIQQDTVTMPPATFAVIETRALHPATELPPRAPLFRAIAGQPDGRRGPGGHVPDEPLGQRRPGAVADRPGAGPLTR